ncbi:hypothetical protein DM02DRAFT_518948 [Periconia macrospinosa]|uniref:Rhodopsin domain-containing protein n=1 Tax=Periconia macrospinosa TaxID=97972 RepID=A0A2V1E3Q3_9PLEO|nr:hypothetical protein DM02DRAFT_518948 [Periconia macrospinosa]
MLNHAPNWIIISKLVAADVGMMALIPAVLLTALAFVTVALRLYSRTFLSKNVKLEDYFVMASLVRSTSIYTDFSSLEVSINTRQNNRKDRIAPLQQMLKLIYAQSLIYHLSVNLVKASILVQYRRVFAQASQITIRCAIILLFITFVCFAWGFFGALFLCTPVKRYWNLDIPGHCINAEHHFSSTSIMGIVLDAAIWVLPLPVVGKLEIRGRQRVGLGVVFGIGAIVCIVSVLRFVLVHDATAKRNVTKAGTHALIWSSSEINVAIICASLLVMKPLLSRWFPILAKSRQSTTAVDDSRRVKRWITAEMVRNRMATKNEDSEPAGLVFDNSQEEKAGDEEDGHTDGGNNESAKESNVL